MILECKYLCFANDKLNVTTKDQLFNLLKTLKKNGSLVVIQSENGKMYALKGRDISLFEPLAEEDAVPENVSKIIRKAPLKDLS